MVSRIKNQLYNLPFVLTFKENHIPLLGFGAKQSGCDNQGPTFYSDSKLFLVLNTFLALVGSFLARVLIIKWYKSGSEADSFYYLGSLVLSLQKNQNFNLFVGFIVSFGLALSYIASPSDVYWSSPISTRTTLVSLKGFFVVTSNISLQFYLQW